MVEVCRRGVPADAAPTVLRAALVERMQQVDADLLFLCGPPGIGKTVLASQYAAATRKPVIWCGLAGESLAGSDVDEQVRSLLGDTWSGAPAGLTESHPRASGSPQHTAEESGPIIVLDDCGVDPGASLMRVTRDLSERLGRSVHQVLVTARTAGSATASDLTGTLVLERDELAFTVAEAHALCAIKGTSCTERAVLDELALSRGHAQLLALRWACRSSSPLPCEELGTRDLAGARRLLRGLLPDADIASLAGLSPLGPCSLAEADRLGGEGFGERLLAVARSAPIISVERTSFGVVEAVLVEDVMGALAAVVASSISVQVDWLKTLAILEERRDWPGCVEALHLHGDDAARLGFLRRRGSALVCPELAEHAIDLVESLARMTVDAEESPWIPLLYARALQALGRTREAIAVAERVAASSAREESAHALVLLAGLRLDVAETAPLETLAAEIEGILAEPGTLDMCATVVTDLASASHAIATSLGSRPGRAVLLDEVHVVSDLIASGDWVAACDLLESMQDPRSLGGALRLDPQVVLAQALTHTGRLSRAAEVIERLRRGRGRAMTALLAPLQVLMGVINGSENDVRVGLVEGFRAAEATGSRHDLSAQHLAACVAHRCGGRHDEAVASAERAVAALHGSNVWGAIDGARLELASSLLAAGDVGAADRVLDAHGKNSKIANRDQAGWASILAALVHLRSGEPERASERLMAQADFIVSGALNLRIALYCRADGDLLRLLASHFGAGRLPGALLAMIDERTARTAIDSSLVPLPTPEIRVLGSRVLGATAFEEQASVVGDAYCTVRLLGGLEIRVGDRTITERDWRKRKARLLFVMLAVHRGCDIARERIFDHLWPDMTEEQARNNFYVAWSTMKSALTGGAGRSGACPFVQSRRGRCRIDSRFV